jgi:hypothetical protein
MKRGGQQAHQQQTAFCLTPVAFNAPSAAPASPGAAPPASPAAPAGQTGGRHSVFPLDRFVTIDQLHSDGSSVTVGDRVQ